MTLKPSDVYLTTSHWIGEYVCLEAMTLFINAIAGGKPGWFEKPHYNTTSWQALHALQDREFLFVADIVLQHPLDPPLRRLVEIRNHRDFLCHPLKYYLKRPPLKEFIQVDRDTNDSKAAILWDLNSDLVQRCGDNDLSALMPGKGHFQLAISVFEESLKSTTARPTLIELQDLVTPFWPKVLAFLERFPTGEVPPPGPLPSSDFHRLHRYRSTLSLHGVPSLLPR